MSKEKERRHYIFAFVLVMLPFLCLFILGLKFIDTSFALAMTFPLVGMTVSITLLPIIVNVVIGNAKS